jgi:hypothetical protein
MKVKDIVALLLKEDQEKEVVIANSDKSYLRGLNPSVRNGVVDNETNAMEFDLSDIELERVLEDDDNKEVVVLI